MRFARLDDQPSPEQESETPEVYDPFKAYLHEVSKHPLMTRKRRGPALRAG